MVAGPLGRSISLAAQPPHPNCEICVVIPVRNERQRLPAALAALCRQRDSDSRSLDPTRYEVLVLVNNASDGSADVARRFAARYPSLALRVVEVTLPPDEAHVGRARRLLMDEACRRLDSLGRPRGVIASTDGDSRVAPDWLAATQRAVAAGADAVGGRIRIDLDEMEALTPDARAYYLLDTGYRLLVAEYEAYLAPDPDDPWPRHFQHFGGSLAVTAETYRLAGGLPAKPWLEDVAFVRALRRVDARLRHDPAVQVVTSARSAGRIEVGLSAQLGIWVSMAETDTPILVEPAGAVAARSLATRRLRELWRHRQAGHRLPVHRDRVAPLAAELGICPGWLWERLVEPAPFGVLLEQVQARRAAAGLWAARWPRADIRLVVPELRQRLSRLRRLGAPGSVPLEEVEPVLLGS
jgi:hypothetical protein